MKNAKSAKRVQLVGELLAQGAVFCPCCERGMYMQGAESLKAFVSRHAGLTGGRTASKGEKWALTATIDHIVPQCNGGTERWENLLVVCRGCNNEKASLSVPEWISLRRNSGRKFKRITEGYLFALHIKASKSLGLRP